MIRMVFFSPSADKKNGWGAVTEGLCSAYLKFFKNELDFELCLPKSEEKKDYIKSLDFKEQINFILPDFVYSFRNPRKLLWYIMPLRKKIRADVVHVLDFPYAISAMRFATSRIPYLVTLCGTYYKPFKKFPDDILFKRVYKKAANVNAISKFTMDLAQKRYKIDKNKINIVHAGVDYDRFASEVDVSKLKEKYGSDKKIIIGVGALKVRKGFDIVIRAMEKVKKEIPEAVYIIVGSGTEENNLKKLSKELKLEDSIFFVGQVGDDYLPAYFHFADVYCHTPRCVEGAFEGFGIVFLEAGAAGKPVVGSNSGGVPDAIVDGETGLIVPENDVEATSKALIKILRDADLSKKMGEHGKKYAEQHRWQSIAGEYFGLYKDLC